MTRPILVNSVADMFGEDVRWICISYDPFSDKFNNVFGYPSGIYGYDTYMLNITLDDVLSLVDACAVRGFVCDEESHGKWGDVSKWASYKIPGAKWWNE